MTGIVTTLFDLEYEDNHICLKQDDCIHFLQSLPTNSVDLIVTDPAYSGMNNHLQLGRGRIIGKYKDKGTETGKWFAEFEDNENNYRTFLSECKRVLRTTIGHIYIMFDSYSLLTLGSLVRDYFDVKNLITWDKINIGMGHYYRRRHEYIVFATNGNTRKLRNQSFPDVWRFKRIRSAEYATQKPVELFQTMIHASTENGFMVCDPFVGSGSSAIAAIKNNCNFIGCDVAEKAIEVSQERIKRFLDTGIDNLQPEPAMIPGEKIFWE
ncbi:MAG: site-specific DNA-methyltransferase [Anaerolineales bacterium]|nr:site-specific DNA-methyltransferase [Anaerolineales bacterium]MCA9928033.1 site-specific DNA-methyltransferase [Anaerolineales bacterium]